MALAMDWRTTASLTSTEAEGTHIADPMGALVALNDVSLALAVITNFALLAQMTDQLRYSVSAPVTIIGWFISSFMLIGLVGATTTHLPVPNTRLLTYSQGFYYACFAAAIHLFLSVMLTMTAIGVHVYHFSLVDTGSPMSQRSLML
jgi:potassium channel subfamily K, other eukaryote